MLRDVKFAVVILCSYMYLKYVKEYAMNLKMICSEMSELEI